VSGDVQGVIARPVLVAIAAVALAGCGSSQPAGDVVSSPTTPESVGTTAYTPPSKPVYTPPTAKGDYASPAELAEALNANGFECRMEDSPGSSITGSLTQTCWLPDGADQVRIDIYSTPEQQADGVALLKGNNWQVVEGNLWTASAQQPATAQAVADALQ
jgi:hypothetical protein